jgi:hypothetical protein
MTHRICRTCRVEKALSEFYVYRDKRSNTSYPHTRCKQCHNADTLQRYRDGHQAHRHLYGAKTALLKALGVTRERFYALHDAQQGRCAICGGPPHGRWLSIDHDHASMTFRGLICRPCNLAIGNMQDNPERLRQAAAYLESRRERAADTV